MPVTILEFCVRKICEMQFISLLWILSNSFPNKLQLPWDNPNLCGKEIRLIMFLSQRCFLIGCLYTISFSIYLFSSEWRKSWFFCWGYTWASSFLSFRWVIIPFIGKNNEAHTVGCMMYLVVLTLRFKCSQFPKDSMSCSDVSCTLYLLLIMASLCQGSNIDLHSTEVDQILLHFLIILMSSCYVFLWIQSFLHNSLKNWSPCAYNLTEVGVLKYILVTPFIYNQGHVQVSLRLQGQLLLHAHISTHVTSLNFCKWHWFHVLRSMHICQVQGYVYGCFVATWYNFSVAI